MYVFICLFNSQWQDYCRFLNVKWNNTKNIMALTEIIWNYSSYVFACLFLTWKLYLKYNNNNNKNNFFVQVHFLYIFYSFISLDILETLKMVEYGLNILKSKLFFNTKQMKVHFQKKKGRQKKSVHFKTFIFIIFLSLITGSDLIFFFFFFI